MTSYQDIDNILINECKRFPHREPRDAKNATVVYSSYLCIGDTRNPTTMQQQLALILEWIKQFPACDILEVRWINQIDNETNPFGCIGRFAVHLEPFSDMPAPEAVAASEDESAPAREMGFGNCLDILKALSIELKAEASNMEYHSPQGLTVSYPPIYWLINAFAKSVDRMVAKSYAADKPHSPQDAPSPALNETST